MTARLRSWWQKIRKPLAVIVVAALLAGVFVLLILTGYRVAWTGFFNKTLWDWLNLLGVLAIPAVVGLGAAWYTAQQGKVSERENKDSQREAALQTYIDKISELLLKEHLDERIADGQLKQEYEQVRKIARVRTITVLTQLDARRLGYVFTFLREAGLMSATSKDDAVSLEYADFRAVNWSQANLFKADLSKTYLGDANLSGASLDEANLSRTYLRKADLSQGHLSDANLGAADLSFANVSKAALIKADLSFAILRGANLSHADLSFANLDGSILEGADLSWADLTHAKVTTKQLNTTKSLKGTIMPDGSRHS